MSLSLPFLRSLSLKQFSHSVQPLPGDSIYLQRACMRLLLFELVIDVIQFPLHCLTGRAALIRQLLQLAVDCRSSRSGQVRQARCTTLALKLPFCVFAAWLPNSQGTGALVVVFACQRAELFPHSTILALLVVVNNNKTYSTQSAGRSAFSIHLAFYSLPHAIASIHVGLLVLIFLRTASSRNARKSFSSCNCSCSARLRRSSWACSKIRLISRDSASTSATFI